MATIDIRATVTCSLGPLISGSLSDEYIQGNGLVKTRGSCELKGIFTPDVGSTVTFSYTTASGTTVVPRLLRVLSSFADPFRNTTTVQLGCKLSYLQNVTPAPTVDGQAAATSGRQQQCLNGYIDYSASSVVTIPVYASTVMDSCLTKLGLTASSNPLSNRFFIESFDLSAGYVTVLGDLLLSEGYLGYLDGSEVLQVVDLAQEGGSGPVIDSSSLIDIGAIGVGDLPGEAVVVRYNALRLKADVTTGDQAASQLRNWEYEETTGDPQAATVRYTASNGSSSVNTYTFIPYSKTTTTYGTNNSFNESACSISGSTTSAPDLSNSVRRRETTQRTILAESANSYCAQLLSAGLAVEGNTEGTITRIEEYQYDGTGQLTQQIASVYEPFFKWAGGLGIDFVYYSGGVATSVTLSTTNVLVEKVVTDYSTIYGQRSSSYTLQAGETAQPPVDGQKITTTTYKNWALTLGGQQGSASIKELAPFTSSSELAAWLNNVSTILVMVDCQVRTQRGRGSSAGQVRPQKSQRLGSATNLRSETTAELAYSLGSSSADRFISFSMPYQSDDYYTSSGVVIKGNASAKALRFGRIQNRLLLGNRNGVNLQVPVAKLPAHPFDPVYLSNGSLMVQYRANAINWAFSKDGIVTSVDALYWGVAGGTGSAWVPVAPGVASFPSLPSVVSGEATVTSLVPPWGETVVTEGVTLTAATVVDYSYLIGPVSSEAATLITRTSYTVGSRLAADAAAFALTCQASTGRYVRAIAATAGSFAISGKSAGNVRSYAIGTNAGTFALSGQSAGLLQGRLPLTAAAGAYALSGYAAGSFQGRSLLATAGSFALSGQAAGLNRTRTLTAAAGSLTTTGQAALFVLSQPSVTTVTYTGSGATRNVTGASGKPGLVWIKQNASGYSHLIFDKLQGTGKYWRTELADLQVTAATSLTAFIDGGVTLGASSVTNFSAANYRAFFWAEGGTATTNTNGTITTTTSVSTGLGYSVMTYTGNGVSGATLGHGLSSTPELILFKRLTSSPNAIGFMGSSLVGNNKWMALNDTGLANTDSTWYQTASSSTITVGNSAYSNASGATYAAYAFTTVAGKSKIGTIQGAGTSVLSVNLGFRPSFLLLKNFSGTTSEWFVCYLDGSGTGYAREMYMNRNYADAVSTKIQFTSTGFSVDTAGPGNNSFTTPAAIYMAFA